MAHKIFLFGLDNAGKTALCSFIKDESNLKTKPTLMFNIDNLILKDIEFQVWDAPGQVQLRAMWNKNLGKSKILLFVLDTADVERFNEAKKELNKVLDDFETRNVSLVFCFHKMDLDKAQNNLKKAIDVFNLSSIQEREVHKLETTIKESEGIERLKNKLVEIIEKERWG
ncbi:MAG: ADP-ribosylation factor-like protein [Promethearchaeota archaeon]